MIDIYFEENYGKLYEKIENGKTDIFEFINDNGSIYHMFIKREIPIELENKTYYDIVTPYGYGGPLITNYKKNMKDKLIFDFIQAFQQHCEEVNIVSEFIRFHPIYTEPMAYSDYFIIEHNRNTVGTNLADFEDPFQAEFSKSCRKNIRRAMRDGVSYKITVNPDNLDKFKDIYYSTMDRNDASDYYYFDDEYFNHCLKYFRRNLLVVEAVYKDKTIAMGMYFIYNKTIHIHLSGTLSDYLYLSPAYILRYATILWGKENGYELVHHGGGRSNDTEDSLYKFKKQFGKNTEFKFYTGKKIWNRAVYKELCKKTNKNSKNMDYFPAYRA